jgi:hypothetical protein
MSSTDTGHGATITFGTSALSYAWRKISAVEQAGEAVEDTVLSEKYFRSFLPGDVYEPGEFEIEYSWGSKTALPTIGVVETITLTLPLASGGATAADLEGDGFIMSRTAFPELTTNGLQQGKMKIAFAGTAGVAPAWTKAT